MGEYRYRKERTEEILIAVLALAGLALALHIFAFHGPSVPSGYTSSSEGAIGIAPPYKIGRGTEPVSKETGGALSNTSNKRVVQNFEQEEVRKPDTDGDGFSDWFEEHYTHTDPKVPNDRYLIWVSCPLERDFKPDWRSRDQLFSEMKEGDHDLVRWFVKRNRFSWNNVIWIYNASFEEFKEAINRIADRSDENDFVYLSINGHGSGSTLWTTKVVKIERPELSSLNKTVYYPNGKVKEIWKVVTGPPINPGEYGLQITYYKPDGKLEKITFESPEVVKVKKAVPYKTDVERYMVFSDGTMVTYREISQILNRIKCQKMLVVWSSCGGNTASDILVKGAAYPRVAIGPTTLIPICKNTRGSFSHRYLAADGWLNTLNDSPYAHLKYLSVRDFWFYHLDRYSTEEIEKEMEKVNRSLKEGTLIIIPPDRPSIIYNSLKMADPWNISRDFYFSETKVKELLAWA